MAIKHFETYLPKSAMELLICEWAAPNFIPSEKNKYNKGVCIVPSDLSTVQHVRTYIEKVTSTFSLSEQSIFELTLVADELVANAILASYAKTGAESILLKWSMENHIFTLTVLDYGGGFKLNDVFDELPQGHDLSTFLRSLKEYREARKATIPLNGELIEHLRFGRGLRIISNLVNKFEIGFHDSKGLYAKELTPNTLGSIITIEYIPEAA